MCLHPTTFHALACAVQKLARVGSDYAVRLIAINRLQLPMKGPAREGCGDRWRGLRQDGVLVRHQ
eukprot:9627176-Alexandrium_andersonii.AAC.1